MLNFLGLLIGLFMGVVIGLYLGGTAIDQKYKREIISGEV